MDRIQPSGLRSAAAGLGDEMVFRHGVGMADERSALAAEHERQTARECHR
jgi:hypothetical protein